MTFAKRLTGIALLMVLSACSVDLNTPGVTLNPKQVSITLPNINANLGTSTSGNTTNINGSITIDPNLGGLGLVSCSAVLDPSVTSVPSGTPVPIDVTAKGGFGPYEVLGVSGSFASNTVVSRTYTNNTNASEVVVDTVDVKDSVGLVAQCSFMVTVQPAGVPPSSLLCTLTSTPSPANANQNITFVATAAGGTGPYSFSNFMSGAASTVVSPLAPTSQTTAQTVISYNAAGTDTASIQLNDSANNVVSCAKVVTVNSAPTVTLVATPASSVVAGSPITLTAIANGFSSAPTSYVFSTTQSGVLISPSGNTATVTSNTQQPTFSVNVVASSSTQTASGNISLAFTAPSVINCSLANNAGVFFPGDTVTFTVVNLTNPSDPLQITYFATNSDASPEGQTDSTRSVSYATSGIKTAQAQAVSKTTGAQCNGVGAVLTDFVQIFPALNPPLSCVGYTNVNPARVNQWFGVGANISGGRGTAWVNTINVFQFGIPYTFFNGFWTGATTAQMQFLFTGNYTLQFNVWDSAGDRTTCNTNVVVNR